MPIANEHLLDLHAFALQDALIATLSIAVTIGLLYLVGFRRRRPNLPAAPREGKEPPHDEEFPARIPSATREREEQVQLVFKAARVGAWTWARNSTEVFCDEQMKALHGLPQDRSIVHTRRVFLAHPSR